MKKIKSLISVSVCAAAALAAVPFSSNAADGDVVYGTMNIPYADFYAAEFEGSANSFEVDAVSSATANKWAANATGSYETDENGNQVWKSGGLSAGTYNDGAGTILGVTYPVAVSSADVDFLTSEYNFTALSEQPAAYKEVTVNGSSITVGKLVDSDGVVDATGSISVETQTSYGDYQLTVDGYPQDADVYGAIVKTADGNYYPMRALENLWRPKSEIAWSVGYVTEVHGNNIDNEKYYPTNGATVTEVTFITLDGYRTVSGNAYLPVIFTDSVDVADAAAGTGSTTYSTADFPDDYSISGSVADGFTVSSYGIVSYKDQAPGSYTLTLSDKNGKYADVKGTFTLTTADIPVKFDGEGALVTADGFTDDDAANFISNISAVTVNGSEPYTPGRRGTTVILSDGSIDFEATKNNVNVFDGSGNYTISVTATGYTEPYEFVISAEEEGSEEETVTTTTTASDDTTTTTTTTTAASDGTASTTTTTTTKKATSTTTTASANSPKTGVAGTAVPAAVIAAAGALALAFRKKND